MTKVHPNAAAASAACDSVSVLERQKASTQSTSGHAQEEVVLTVWKKSLLPSCNGFTVFDGQGDLVFRVDNYIAGNKDEILLMDAAGNPLLTIRRKRLSLGDNWLVFEGEASGKPIFVAKKHVSILKTKCLAQVLTSSETKGLELAYEMEGSYKRRCCTIYDSKRTRVAEINKKEVVAMAGGVVAFGTDVFRLIIEPGMNPTLAMAFVILLDLMFGS